MKITLLIIAVILSTACSQPQPAPVSQPVTVQCPADSTCDVNVTPPPMTSVQIQYHAQQHDLADDVLIALMMQDMAWRQCYGCYNSYYDRYPTMRTQVTYVSNLPSSQRATYVQTNNTTIIQKNTTVIQQKTVADPPSVKAPPAPATTSANSSGTGGGNAVTNKAPAPAAPQAPAQVTKPAAPPPAPPAPPARAPAPPAPPAPAPKR